MGDIPYNLMFQKGERLIFQLRNGVIFEGEYCGGSAHHFNIINARQHNNLNALGGLYSIHRNEVDQIYQLKVNQEKEKNPVVAGKKIIELIDEEYYRLREMYMNYVYIHSLDRTYFKAIMTLNQTDKIAVIPFGMGVTRFGKIQLLAFCTWKTVFLFDLELLKDRLSNYELKKIFESESICKVVHKGGPFMNILQQNYNVSLRNKFDTQVVDLVLQTRKDGKMPDNARNLSECLVEYLNMPTCFLNDAEEACSKSWVERPLRDDQLKGAALQVTYLFILKNRLKKILLSDVYKSVDDMHIFFGGLPHFIFVKMCQTNATCEDMAQFIPDKKKVKPGSEPEEEN